MNLTTDDLTAIKELMGLTIDEKVDELGLITKKDLKHLPNKDQLYEESLKILKKLDDVEVQMKLLSGRTYSNTDRIESVEKIHPHGKHTVTN